MDLTEKFCHNVSVKSSFECNNATVTVDTVQNLYDVKVGAQAVLDVKGNSSDLKSFIKDYNFGAEYSRNGATVSVLSNNKGTGYTLGAHVSKVSIFDQLAVRANFVCCKPDKKSFDLGGIVSVDSNSTLQAKLASSGAVTGVYTYKISDVAQL